MLCRLVVPLAGLSVLAGLAGCTEGAGDQARPTPQQSVSRPSPARPVTLAEAREGIRTMDRINEAWKKRDCAQLEQETMWAANILATGLCKAAAQGAPTPPQVSTAGAEFVLPQTPSPVGWFVAYVKEPRPAYLLFVRERGQTPWRLAGGPMEIRGQAPELEPNAPASAVHTQDADLAVKVDLAPQNHVGYLTDRVLGGEAFPEGDEMRALRQELSDRTAAARPDIVTPDVRLTGDPALALGLPQGGALVFHAIEVQYLQRPAAGKTTLARPLYPAGQLRAYAGQAAPLGGLTGKEMYLLATRVDGRDVMTSVAVQKGLASIAIDAPGAVPGGSPS